MPNFIFSNRDLLSAFGLSQKKIAQILNKPGVTIEELLQEEETISECKAQNNKLLEFITQPQNMSKLIQYITREPSDPQNRDKTYKYPFVASDILSSCGPIFETFLKPEEIKQELKKDEDEKTQQKEHSQSPPKQQSSSPVQAENDTQIVQNILKQEQKADSGNNDGSQPEKQQLVDDLDQEITGDEEQSATNTNTNNKDETASKEENTNSKVKAEVNVSGEETAIGESKAEDTKENKQDDLQKVVPSDKDDKKENDNEKTDEDPNVDGENEESEEKNGVKEKFEIKSTEWKNKPNKFAAEEKQPVVTHSYRLMDELVGFLDQEEVIPILCGYFTKVVSALLNKSKPKFLQYVLISKDGILFNKLLQHLEHHSLAQLLIELMQVKIGVDRGASEDWDKNSDDGNKTKSQDGEEDMSPTELQMSNVLKQKKQEVITYLIRKVSSQGTDFEECLNAQTILNELSENEGSFMVLTKTNNMAALFESACDINNKNQAYAINILTHIFKEYPEHDKSMSQTQMQEFQQLIAEHFLHVIYQCIILLRSVDPSASEKAPNQTDVLQRRVGLKKLRALELVKQSMQTLSKYSEQQNLSQHINKIMKRQIINTMLFMLDNFSFSSITNQLAIQVLDQLKNSFDQEDVASLKAFVQRQLSSNMEFEYESGRKGSAMALGQIVQMALELKSLSQMTATGGENSAEDEQWNTFCNTHVRRAEERWTKKLEDYDYLPSEEDTKTDEDEQDGDIEAQIYHDDDEQEQQQDDADENEHQNDKEEVHKEPEEVQSESKDAVVHKEEKIDTQAESQQQQERNQQEGEDQQAAAIVKEEHEKQEEQFVEEEQKEDKEFNQVSIQVLISTKRKQSIDIGSESEPMYIPDDALQKKHKDDWELKISQDKTLKKAFMKLAAEEPSIVENNEIIKEILSVPAEAESAEDLVKASLEQSTENQQTDSVPEQTNDEVKENA